MISQKNMSKIILLRHGLSQWNLENKFTGWTDVPLAEEGIKEAHRAGQLIKDSGIQFDLAYSSVLERAQKTLDIVLEEIEKKDLPKFYSWRLNERHYGSLQGLNKKEIAEKYGDEQTNLWRRSYDVPPPLLSPEDPTAPKNLEKYKDVPAEDLPLGESLKDTEKRVLPLWEEEILPKIKEGKNILIALSGNSCRAIVKNLDNISSDEITGLNIPTAEPLVYEFDEEGNPVKHYYLSSDDVIASKIDAVKNQTKA